MGAKRASSRKQSNANANANFSYNNVVNLNTFQKPKTVHILPRNKNQETIKDTPDILPKTPLPELP